MIFQVHILCNAPTDWNWLEDGEPRGCWWWWDGERHGPYETRALAFAAAEAAHPGEGIG